MHAVIVAIVLLGAEPIPSADDVAGAEADLQEVFGDDLKVADTNKQRTDLARKLIETAAESRPAAKWALLQKARELAVAAGDSALGVEAVEELVAGFAPETQQEAAGWASEGHRLWNATGRKRPEEKLQGRLEAAECYLRALEGLEGFQKGVVEARLRELGWITDLTPAEVMKRFPHPTWKAISDETLAANFGRVHGSDGWTIAQPAVGVRSLDFSLEMLAPKDLAILVEVDGSRHAVIFGSRGNTTRTWWSGRESAVESWTPRDLSKWHSLSVTLRAEEIAFAFDGIIERKVLIPKAESGHTVRFGFGHHLGPAEIRRVRVTSQHVNE
jgi:hypothetical protein